MNKNKLYIILFFACLAGYIWLTWSVFYNRYDTSVCLFKHFSGIPCPSCGTTRAVTVLLQGEILGSILLNPFGIIVASIMVISPLWILKDVITGSSSLYESYIRMEKIVRYNFIAILLIVLVLFNWIWNIYKGL